MQALRRVLTRDIDVRTLTLCVAILALNLIDAFATLRHLEHGAEELNPFMVALLHHGALSFLVVKHTLASVGVLGIAIYPRQRAANIALAILFPIYFLLALYQLGLFYLM
ncbi:MAG TPA: DUF5658 family protein [Polyangia bacterium]|nr:DUF5658 family protein [Polyangia bacterium]